MVFSGIIETQARITSVSFGGSGGRENGVTLTVEPILSTFMDTDITLGCSIAVNGTCLTVTQFDSKTFRVDLAPETLRKTSFGEIIAGSLVNLEKALRSTDRNSGHTVQGHIDGTGKILSVHSEGVSLVVKISTLSMTEEVATLVYFNSMIVPKGFIAVDGASLTICEVNKNESWFTLMLIPHTQEVLKPWNIDDLVNIELDCLAKYVSATVGNLHDINYLEMRLYRLEIFALSVCVISLLAIVWNRK